MAQPLVVCRVIAIFYFFQPRQNSLSLAPTWSQALHFPYSLSYHSSPKNLLKTTPLKTFQLQASLTSCTVEMSSPKKDRVLATTRIRTTCLPLFVLIPKLKRLHLFVSRRRIVWSQFPLSMAWLSQAIFPDLGSEVFFTNPPPFFSALKLFNYETTRNDPKNTLSTHVCRSCQLTIECSTGV